MKFMKSKKIITIVLICVMILSSCSLVQDQKMIDNIIPDYTKRMYTIADLIPYTYKEIRNAQALYGRELTDFFYNNTTTESEAKRQTDKEKKDFLSELRYRNHNYKIIKKRFSMYVEDEYKSKETKEAERNKEYDEYYKLSTAKSANIIKKYNDGKLQGMPLISIRVDMSTATMSDINNIYSEAMCEIYKPVYIEDNQYKRLKFGDTIELQVPVVNSEVYKKETKKVTCTYVATDSLLYKDDDGKDAYYFIADIDGTNDVHRILDYYGKTLETYSETAMLQFMKYARVARANEAQRLMDAVANDNLVEYNFDELAVRALGGGYLVYEYKDFIYANSVTTNLKGYITSLTYYDNQRIDNKFYDSLS